MAPKQTLTERVEVIEERLGIDADTHAAREQDARERAARGAEQNEPNATDEDEEG